MLTCSAGLSRARLKRSVNRSFVQIQNALSVFNASSICSGLSTKAIVLSLVDASRSGPVMKVLATSRVQEGSMERPIVLSPDGRIGTASHLQIELSTFHNGHWVRSPRRHLSALPGAIADVPVCRHDSHFSGRSECRSYRACLSQQTQEKTVTIVETGTKLSRDVSQFDVYAVDCPDSRHSVRRLY